MNLQNRMVLFLILCVSFTLLSNNLYASSGISAVAQSAAKVKVYMTNVTVLARSIGGIVGCVGAIKIYTQWSLGDRKIIRPLLFWAGAMIFLHVGPPFLLQLFYGNSLIKDPGQMSP
jgi:hypothetical protein